MTKRKTLADFLDAARKVHGTKYNYSLVHYVNNRTKVKIICSKHGEFQQTPYAHLKSDCNQCGYDKMAAKRNRGRDEFITKAKEVHGDKYKYDKVVYTLNKKKVIITCDEHGDFQQTPAHHLNGSGCSGCSRTKQLTTEDFIKRAEQVHNKKYKYTKVVYKNAHSNVIITCDDHGDFSQNAQHHLNAHGCPKCARIVAISKTKKNNDQFLKEAKETHGDKYNYSMTKYVNNKTKLTIICPKHGEFQQAPHSHINGHEGCPKCSNCGFSNISLKVLLFHNPQLRTAISPKGEKTIKVGNKSYKVDGYCKKTNTVYEFHGDFWHGNPNNKKVYSLHNEHPARKKLYGQLLHKTLQKEMDLKAAGYNYKCIWESEIQVADLAMYEMFWIISQNMN